MLRNTFSLQPHVEHSDLFTVAHPKTRPKEINPTTPDCPEATMASPRGSRQHPRSNGAGFPRHAAQSCCSPKGAGFDYERFNCNNFKIHY